MLAVPDGSGLSKTTKKPYGFIFANLWLHLNSNTSKYFSVACDLGFLGCLERGYGSARQATGPPRQGAGVGDGMLIVLGNLKDSKI